MSAFPCAFPKTARIPFQPAYRVWFAVPVLLILSQRTAIASEIKTASLSVTGSLGWWIAIGLMIALLLSSGTLLILYRLRTRSLSQRCAALLSHTFESVSEFDVRHHVRYEYQILNDMPVRTRMLESLRVYLDRFLQNSVNQADSARLSAYLTTEALRTLVTQGSSQEVDFRMRSQKGEEVWRRALLIGLPNSFGAEDRVLWCLRDIHIETLHSLDSGMRAAEALAQAEQRSKTHEEFLNLISHEIRTPLNAITGFLALAQQSRDQPARLESCLGKAELATCQLTDMLGELLDLSYLGKNRFALTLRPFCLHTLTEELRNETLRLAREKGVAFDTDWDYSTDTLLLGDQLRLHQVLFHLLENAVKFTDRGGQVTFRIRETGRQRDRVYFLFQVADTGAGLREGYMERIFIPFAQEEGYLGRTHGGAGLGLPLVKHLTELMGGTLSVNSKLGEGSTFTITLPLTLAQPSASESLCCEQLSALRLLVVDDRQSVLESATAMLRTSGLSSALAISGDVAVQKTVEAAQSGQPYDLIFLHWALRGMSAQETHQQLVEHGADRAGIVAVLENGETIPPEDGNALGLQRYLSRPVQPDQLFALLTGFWQERNATVPNGSDATKPLIGRVLLAEDNELNRDIAQELLISLGLSVDAVADGLEAVEHFTAQEPGYYQLIVMDIQMPSMDGYEATRVLRSSKRPDAATVPIIAMSANAFPEDIARSLAAGMSDHLPKPVDTVVLRHMMQKWLPVDSSVPQGYPGKENS